ncbi:MAG TPA: cyclohexanecarboxylate-CoA ligase, partial [Alphaproteobacteria bacterium]|nr:cyclohexanecarboxylate-CoA ligase [Alphaproteobacteria bacterium]
MDLGVILPPERIAAMREAGLWPDRVLLDYLDEAVAGNGEATAIVSYNGETGEATSLSYAELDRLTRR